MTRECRFPLLMLVTMRGDHGEFNPAQIPMGDATQRVLEAMGVIVKRADTPEDVPEMVSSALRLAFNTYRPLAVLIGLMFVLNWEAERAALLACASLIVIGLFFIVVGCACIEGYDNEDIKKNEVKDKAKNKLGNSSKDKSANES